MQVKILKNSSILCQNAKLANNAIARMVGLLGKQSFCEVDGLLLQSCSQIHSIGMQFEFDAIYLDKDYRIIALYEKIVKNRIMPYNNLAKVILELPSGNIEANNLEIGDELKVIKN